MTQLDGRVAVVTGASRGLGRACARKLAAEGAMVHGPFEVAVELEPLTHA